MLLHPHDVNYTAHAAVLRHVVGHRLVAKQEPMNLLDLPLELLVLEVMHRELLDLFLAQRLAVLHGAFPGKTGVRRSN
jgi:hypothetical protein